MNELRAELLKQFRNILDTIPPEPPITAPEIDRLGWLTVNQKLRLTAQFSEQVDALLPRGRTFTFDEVSWRFNLLCERIGNMLRSVEQFLLYQVEYCKQYIGDELARVLQKFQNEMRFAA